MFQINGYLTSLIDKCFKKVLDTTKPTLPMAEKKSLPLALPHLGLISLQLRIKIRNSMNSTLNCCKLQVIFKSEKNPSDMFRFKIMYLQFSVRCGL